MKLKEEVMKKKMLSMLLCAAMFASILSGCAISTTKESDDSNAESTEGTESTDDADADSDAEAGDDVVVMKDEDLEGREEITLWFWGAEPYAQEAFKKILVDSYNASQDEYQLVVEFRPSVDADIKTALAANQGPDIIYGSGPSFVMPLVEAEKLENMDGYAEEYGWKDKILEPYYESGTVHGSLYSLVNGVSTMGVFYNKKVLQGNVCFCYRE